MAVPPKIMLTAQHGLSAGMRMHEELSKAEGEKLLQRAGVAEFKNQREEALLTGVGGEDALSALEAQIQANERNRLVRVLHGAVAKRRGELELNRKTEAWRAALRNQDLAFQEQLAKDQEAHFERVRELIEAQQANAAVGGTIANPASGQVNPLTALSEQARNIVNNEIAVFKNDTAAANQWLTNSQSGFGVALLEAIAVNEKKMPGVHNYVTPIEVWTKPQEVWQTLEEHYPGVLPPWNVIVEQGQRIGDSLRLLQIR